jgi:hypothetical protein
MTAHPRTFRTGCSHAVDPDQAARELREALGSEDLALAGCFAAPAYDCESLAGALEREFGDVPVIGCTTAGEISPAGFSTGSLTGFGLAAEDFEVELLLLEGLRRHQ